LGDGDSLIDAGLIDSTGVLELVGFLEQEFGIDVADEDLVPENLDSIARLAAFIDRKRADRVDVSPQ
jgi:acyl carrier protein